MLKHRYNTSSAVVMDMLTAGINASALDCYSSICWSLDGIQNSLSKRTGFLHWMILIKFCESYKIRNSSMCSVRHTSVPFWLFSSNILPSTLFWSTLKFFFPVYNKQEFTVINWVFKSITRCILVTTNYLNTPCLGLVLDLSCDKLRLPSMFCFIFCVVRTVQRLLQTQQLSFHKQKVKKQVEVMLNKSN